MRYQPWNPFNPWGLSDEERGAQAVGMGVLLVIGLGVAGWHGCVKSKHADEPVTVTKTVPVDPKHEQWHIEDKRGLFHWTYEGITAKNAEDSSFAKKEHLDLIAFDTTKQQVTVSEYYSKGRRWERPETMNYKIGE